MIKINNMVITEVDNKMMEDATIARLVESARKDLPFEKKVKVSKQNGTYTISIWKDSKKADFYMSNNKEFEPEKHAYKIVFNMSGFSDFVENEDLRNFYNNKSEIDVVYVDDEEYAKFLLSLIHEFSKNELEKMNSEFKNCYRLVAC